MGFSQRWQSMSTAWAQQTSKSWPITPTLNSLLTSSFLQQTSISSKISPSSSAPLLLAFRNRKFAGTSRKWSSIRTLEWLTFSGGTRSLRIIFTVQQKSARSWNMERNGRRVWIFQLRIRQLMKLRFTQPDQARNIPASETVQRRRLKPWWITVTEGMKTRKMEHQIWILQAKTSMSFIFLLQIPNNKKIFKRHNRLRKKCFIWCYIHRDFFKFVDQFLNQ